MIVFHIDVMLAKRKMSLTELSERVGITMANLSILKTGKAKAVRLETLGRLCAALDCQPGDLMEFLNGEVRYNSLKLGFPERAEKLFEKGEECAMERYKELKHRQDSFRK